MSYQIKEQRRAGEQPAEETKPAESANEHRWAVILAGGDGTRLSSLTRMISGDERPKQFCPIIGGETLLQQTVRRVALAVKPEQMMFVVTEKHERFYDALLSDVSRRQLVIQPRNQGTAPAILYSLLRLAQMDSQATVAFFPSDHYFSDEEAFMSHVESAFAATITRPDRIVLLGITPECPEVEYGWIEPDAPTFTKKTSALARVRRFWEKPSLPLARKLMTRNCLWNSFVMVGRIDAFLRVIARTVPELFEAFATAQPSFETSAETEDVRALYSRIPSTNFSQEVLAMCPNNLDVLAVCGVGWSDLGEPARVLNTFARIGQQAEWAASTG